MGLPPPAVVQQRENIGVLHPSQMLLNKLKQTTPIVPIAYRPNPIPSAHLHKDPTLFEH